MPSTNGEPSVSGGVNDMSTSDVRMGRDERDKGTLSLSLFSLARNSSRRSG